MYVGESVCESVCDGLLGSGFDGITEFAVVLVSAFSELQAM